ncbi:MAG: hypothetical protein AABZ12_13635 [Planctomycetota bacterium]
MKRRVLVVLAALAAVTTIASISIAAGGGGPNACPAIWAPVICDGGKVYPNQCEADRHKAKNCVPYCDI